MFLVLLVTACASLYHLSTACSREELVLIQVISNHGSTAPHELYPTDPNLPILWREGPGQLTKLGKFQSFALGGYLRARYNGFITSDPTEVEVLSSSEKPCVLSALSEVSSLYAPTFWHEVVLKFPWQPIMVHYSPPHEDKVFSSSFCPVAQKEYRLVSQSPEAQQFLSEHRNLLDYWSLQSGWNVKNWEDVRDLHNVLNAERAHNFTVPQWAQQNWKEIRYIARKSHHWRSKTKLLRRLLGGPLVKRVVEKLSEKASRTIPEKKVFVYSTHSDNLASFLNCLNLFNGEEPPPCASVVIELYNHAQEYYVRLLYLNSTTPELEPQYLHLMTLDGCTEFCPLDYVVNYTKDLIPNNWNEECELKL